MSDQPKKNLNDADKEKNSSSNNAFSLENSEPSSNPSTLPSARRSSETDEKKKKLNTGPKAVLPGAVAESTAASNDKQPLSPAQNSLTEFVDDKEEKKGSNYRRRKVASPRLIAEPTAVTNKKGATLPINNTAENQINASTASTSLEGAEPYTSPASMKLEGADKKIKTGPKATSPGAVEGSTVADEGFKGNKYQRKIAASRGISGGTGNNATLTSVLLPPDNHDVDNALTASTSIVNSEPVALPISNDLSGGDATDKARRKSKGAVQQSVEKVSPSTEEDSRSREYRQYSSVTESQDSSFNNLAMELSDNGGVTMPPSGIASLQNSEPSAFLNTQQSHDVEPGSIPVESSHYNAQFISRDTPNAEGLVVATLVESNRDIYGNDVIIDAIVIDDRPIEDKTTPWYRRTLLMFGIIVIIAAAVSGAVTIFLFGESDGTDTVPVFRSVAPSFFPSNTPSMVPSLSLLPSTVPTYAPSLSLLPSTVPTYAPSLSPFFILRALYESTDGTNWSNPWDFSIGQSYCNFHGITCDGLDQITEIRLIYNKLRGSLPSEMGMLSSLERIRLYDNSITGTIPSEIGMLSSLKGLYLNHNLITGTIPSEIGMLSSLTGLNLNRNLITGSIPTELCALTNTSIYYDEDEISCACFDSISFVGTPCDVV